MLSVFGSINLDVSVRAPQLPHAGETLLGGAALLSPGGKGANQAHAAQRFGVATRLFAMVGDDSFAAPALACLVAAGVDTGGVGVSSGDSTGLALITVSEAGENTIVVASGANLAARAAQVSDAVLKDSRVLLLQLELAPAESFALAERAAARLQGDAQRIAAAGGLQPGGRCRRSADRQHDRARPAERAAPGRRH